MLLHCLPDGSNKAKPDDVYDSLNGAVLEMLDVGSLLACQCVDCHEILVYFQEKDQINWKGSE